MYINQCEKIRQHMKKEKNNNKRNKSQSLLNL